MFMDVKGLNYGKLTFTIIPGSILNPVIYMVMNLLYFFHFGDWASQINYSLVNSHFPSVPGVTTFTARCLSASDLQSLSWHSNWSSEFVGHFLGLLQYLVAYIFQGLDVLSRQCQSDKLFVVLST